MTWEADSKRQMILSTHRSEFLITNNQNKQKMINQVQTEEVGVDKAKSQQVCFVKSRRRGWRETLLDYEGEVIVPCLHREPLIMYHHNHLSYLPFFFVLWIDHVAFLPLTVVSDLNLWSILTQIIFFCQLFSLSSFLSFFFL